MKDKNFLPALLAGAAAGAILGVLFAPQAGKELREELKADCDNWMSKLKIKKQESEWDSEPVDEQAIPNL